MEALRRKNEQQEQKKKVVIETLLWTSVNWKRIGSFLQHGKLKVYCTYYV